MRMTPARPGNFLGSPSGHTASVWASTTRVVTTQPSSKGCPPTVCGYWAWRFALGWNFQIDNEAAPAQRKYARPQLSPLHMLAMDTSFLCHYSGRPHYASSEIHTNISEKMRKKMCDIQYSTSTCANPNSSASAHCVTIDTPPNAPNDQGDKSSALQTPP